MHDVKQELTNPESRARWKHSGNWNRLIQIPGVWSGHVKDIPPHAVEVLIKQGRKDFEPIAQSKQKQDSASADTGKTNELSAADGSKK